MTTSTRTVFQTLFFGLVGAGLGTWIGLPVAPLLGSAILVSILTLSGVRTASSAALRNVCFVILGCSLGAGITPENLALIGRWPLSLVALALTVVLMMYTNTWLLARFYGQSVETGLLASSPGALSSVLALANSGYGNERAVIVLQGLRLILVMSVLPIIIEGLDLQGSNNMAYLQITMPYTLLPSLLGIALILALILDKFHFPAAYVMAGLLISALGHGSELLTGRMPQPLVTIAFIVIGCSVGVRFNGIQRHELKIYAGAALASVMLSSVIAAGMAYLVAMVLHLPFGQVWIAYAPGGVEAMAALAMALHYDPAYIAVHHLSRIIGLAMLVPWIMTLLKRS
ncbi:AbrB family transcriptional regulator [Thiofilum flexile]|uniref:AbrB family transcriptional regulator n=1 Tax=Thiofilum flexile TaxID=125627 RepID=UPI00037EF56D|nr:AbrB family transcriptional regulator [Thiofilum flexile]